MNEYQRRYTGIVARMGSAPLELFNGKGNPPLIEDTPVVELEDGRRVFIPPTIRQRYGGEIAPTWQPGQVFDETVFWFNGQALLLREAP